MSLRLNASAAAIALCLSAAAIPHASFAQDITASQAGSTAQTYTPDYFTQFQPQTAADMVDRLPGFSITGNEGGERGFGQASLNLLINGRRPSAKSSDANQILSRIPATNVKRIEIVDGASLDIPGLSGQVANIITASTKLSGSWEYAARFEEGTEPQLLEGQVSLSGERGNLSFVASLKADEFTFTEDGREQYFDGEGVLIEDRDEQPYYALNTPSANLNLTWTPQADHVANLNLSGQLINQRGGVNEQFSAITAAGQTGESEINNNEDEYNYEIGGDYSLPAMGGSLKLIGLYRFEKSEFNSLGFFNIFGETPTRQIFDHTDDESETIARGEYSLKPGTEHDLQLAVEAAFNVLDSSSTFSATGIDAIDDAVRVEEDRFEGNVTHSWTVNDKLSLQSSLGAEFSKLHVVSGQDPAREFVRPKGFLSASYTASPRYTWRARAERKVGQLNFRTFVSGVSISDATTSAGNSEIVPNQSWLGEIELARKDDKVLSGTARLYAEIIDDPIDRLRFDNGTPDDLSDDREGPGNLDRATIFGAEVNGTWMLDRAGLRGGRMTFQGQVQDTNIDDPLTGENRKINDAREWFYNATLRHDIPKTDYAWFTSIQHESFAPFFRLDQSFAVSFDRPELRFGVEHKDFLGMKLVVRLDNILDKQIERERDIFTPDRLGALSQRQVFERNRGRRLSFVLSDTF